MLRRRRSSAPSTTVESTPTDRDGDELKPVTNSSVTVPSSGSKREKPKWSCIDCCCWLIGNISFFYFLIYAIYHAIPRSKLQQLQEVIVDALGAPAVDPPGPRLASAGLKVKHPVVFVPGIVTGGLELWQGQPCASDLFRKRLWGGTFGQVYKRPLCWLEHMILDNETGLDPPGVRVRSVAGLVAADYFMPGYAVWAVIIEQLASLGYDERSLHMASYDWRLSFENTEARDRSLSRLKSTIELLVETNGGEKAVIVPHSMGSLYFLYFMSWVEAPAPLGGGGGPGWVSQHIRAVVNIGGPLLGVPKAFTGLFSAEAKDVAVARDLDPGNILEGLQTLQYVMHLSRTWDATMSMLPKGGDAVWGGLHWAPEEGFRCQGLVSRNSTRSSSGGDDDLAAVEDGVANYGRMVSFGLDISMASGDNFTAKLEDTSHGVADQILKPWVGNSQLNRSCGELWTEYEELDLDTIKSVVEEKVYTARDIPDLLRTVAPKMMARSDSNWGLGIAHNLSDPKYNHPKYWANPLESRLPEAPDLEVYCMYGVGLLTERAYVYRMSTNNDTCLIPYRIDVSIQGKSQDPPIGCLKDGVYFVDGDETVPALSAGFMCTKGWRGKTRFNPSGAKTFVREFQHTPPASILEGRGTQSGSHVDIMGNFALIEDILKIAAGYSGGEVGGDRIYSEIQKWSDRVLLDL